MWFVLLRYYSISNFCGAVAYVSAESDSLFATLPAGNKMARRLRDLNFTVTVWNRNVANAAPLAEVLALSKIS